MESNGLVSCVRVFAVSYHMCCEQLTIELVGALPATNYRPFGPLPSYLQALRAATYRPFGPLPRSPSGCPKVRRTYM